MSRHKNIKRTWMGWVPPLQRSKGVINVRMPLILNFGSSVGDSSLSEFVNFKSTESSPQRSELCAICLQRWIPDLWVQGVCILSFHYFTHSTTIDFSFHSRKRIQSKSRTYFHHFTNGISFDLIIQKNNMKSFTCVFVSWLHFCPRWDKIFDAQN